MCSRVSFGSHEQDEYLFYIPSPFYLNHGILYTLFYTLVFAIICFCCLNHLGDFPIWVHKELLTIFLLLCSILLYACNILYLPTPYWWTHGTQLSYFKKYCSEKLTSFHSYAQILACSGFTSLLEPFQASWAIHFFHFAFLFSEILWCPWGIQSGKSNLPMQPSLFQRQSCAFEFSCTPSSPRPTPLTTSSPTRPRNTSSRMDPNVLELLYSHHPFSPIGGVAFHL